MLNQMVVFFLAGVPVVLFPAYALRTTHGTGQGTYKQQVGQRALKVNESSPAYGSRNMLQPWRRRDIRWF